MDLNINLSSPKGFLPLLLFLGVALVLVGNMAQAITADSTLVTDGWIVVIGAIGLWVFAKLLGSNND